MFAKNIAVAFPLFFAGPFMIFPNVGLNEWGHTFWFMGELFTPPLQRGFVFFGWQVAAGKGNEIITAKNKRFGGIWLAGSLLALLFFYASANK